LTKLPVWGEARCMWQNDSKYGGLKIVTDMCSIIVVFVPLYRTY